MSAPELDLHIDRLVLHDLPSHQRERIAAALAAEFERLVAEQGLPPGLAKGAAIDLPAHTVTVAAGLKPESIGAQIAQTLFHGFVTGHTAKKASPSRPSSQHQHEGRR